MFHLKLLHKSRAARLCLITGGLLLFFIGTTNRKAHAQTLVFDIVGDSVSAGVNPGLNVPDYGWAQMLFGEGGGPLPAPKEDTIFDIWPNVEVNNSAVSGSTAAEWAAAGSLLMQGVVDNAPDIVVVLIGGNDFIAAADDGMISQEELNAIFANIATIVDILQALPSQPEIILLDYYDLFDGFSENLPANFSEFRPFSQAVVAAGGMLQELASDKNIRFISIYDDFLHHCYGRVLGDPAPLEPPYVRLPIFQFDIHPVTAGHSAIYEEVYDGLIAIQQDSVNGFTLR